MQLNTCQHATCSGNVKQDFDQKTRNNLQDISFCMLMYNLSKVVLNHSKNITKTWQDHEKIMPWHENNMARLSHVMAITCQDHEKNMAYHGNNMARS